MIAAIMVNPVMLTNVGAFTMLLPLLLLVSAIYKTVRTHDLRRLWWDIIVLTAYMIAGLLALGAALWLIHSYWP